MTEFLVVVVLLLGNAFFVGSEFALIASRRTVVEPMAATSRRARAALRAMNDIPLMIAGAQLGITICSLGLGAIAEPAFAHLLEVPFEAIGLPASATHAVAFALALLVVVYLHTVVGEMVPKNLTLAGPEATVLWPADARVLPGDPAVAGRTAGAASILRLWRIRTDGEDRLHRRRAGQPCEPGAVGRPARPRRVRSHRGAWHCKPVPPLTMRPWSEITTGRWTSHRRSSKYCRADGPVPIPGRSCREPAGSSDRPRWDAIACPLG
jgi:hypothetical protein